MSAYTHLSVSFAPHLVNVPECARAEVFFLGIIGVVPVNHAKCHFCLFWKGGSNYSLHVTHSTVLFAVAADCTKAAQGTQEEESGEFNVRGREDSASAKLLEAHEIACKPQSACNFSPEILLASLFLVFFFHYLH